MNYVYDENENEGLALVADEHLNNVRYVQLAECPKLQRRNVPQTYLVQAHFAARSHPISLPAEDAHASGQTMVKRVDAMRTGWRRGDWLK